MQQQTAIDQITVLKFMNSLLNKSSNQEIRILDHLLCNVHSLILRFKHIICCSINLTTDQILRLLFIYIITVYHLIGYKWKTWQQLQINRHLNCYFLENMK